MPDISVASDGRLKSALFKVDNAVAEGQMVAIKET
jgi:hypothetical protein